MWRTKHEDFIAFEQYYDECDDPTKYALRLLCPCHHAVFAVCAWKGLGQIHGESGAGKRLDCEYTLICGCTRRKGLRNIESAVHQPRHYTKMEKRTVRRVEDDFKDAAQEVAHG
jgi:hypothetical protein